MKRPVFRGLSAHRERPRAAGRRVHGTVRRTARKRCLWNGIAVASLSRGPEAFSEVVDPLRCKKGFAARPVFQPAACMADPNRPRDPGKGEAFSPRPFRALAFRISSVSGRTLRPSTKAPPPARIDTLRDPSGGGRTVRIRQVPGAGKITQKKAGSRRRFSFLLECVLAVLDLCAKQGRGGFGGRLVLLGLAHFLVASNLTLGHCRTPIVDGCHNLPIAGRMQGLFSDGPFPACFSPMRCSALPARTVCNCRSAAYIGDNEAASPAVPRPVPGPERSIHE